MKKKTAQKEKISENRSLITMIKDVLKSDRFRVVVVPVLFFFSFFAYLLLYIDPAVIYSGNGFNVHPYIAMVHAKDVAAYSDLLYRPFLVIELTSEYFRNVFLVPGGLMKFAVTLCIYACHYPVAGALLITAFALFFSWIFLLYLQFTAGRRTFLWGVLPSFLILMMCTWYELSYCMFLVPVAGALSLAVLYRWKHFSGVTAGVLSLTGMFWLAWYLLGWGSLLFLVFAIIQECHTGRERTAVTVIAALSNAALLLIVDSMLLPLQMRIHWESFRMMSGLPLVFICSFPLVAVAVALSGRFREKVRDKLRFTGRVMLAGGMIAGAVWLFRGPVNRDTRTVARLVHHVTNGEWNVVLHENTTSLFRGFPEKAGALQAFAVHVVNHALCRAGRLGDRLFDFPQATFSSYDPLLMLQSLSVHSYINWFVVLDCAMDLGMVNTAEKIAGELMENMGPFPEILYRRALVQIAKGNHEAAAVYLGRLSNMPFYRAGAEQLLQMIRNDDSFVSEPRVKTMIENKDTVDYFISNTLSSEKILRYLLQTNPRNRSAYDYLMSWYLLHDRLDVMASVISFAPSFGYKVLPRYWEEALCLYQSDKISQTAGAPAFPGVGKETVERFFGFTREWMKIKNDPDVAEKMKPLYGDSYFYFAMFRHSPGSGNE